MTTSPNPYRGFRFPAEIIEHAVWLYHCFSLSLRDVETILAARGIVVGYETTRDWSLRRRRLNVRQAKGRCRHRGQQPDNAVQRSHHLGERLVPGVILQPVI